jgi:hypothetical protein
LPVASILAIESILEIVRRIISEPMMSKVSIEEYEAMNGDGNNVDFVSNIHYLPLSQCLALLSNDRQTQPPGRRMRLSRMLMSAFPQIRQYQA